MRRRPSKTARWILLFSISSRGPMRRCCCATWRTRKTASRINTAVGFSLQLQTDILQSVGQVLLCFQSTVRVGNDVRALLWCVGDHLLQVWQLGRLSECA